MLNKDLHVHADKLFTGQTFEGGISGAPGNEAHGAYAFCALAALCIMGQPGKMMSRYNILLSNSVPH